MGFGRTVTSGLVLAGFWSVAIADSSDIDGKLRRRAMFGAQLAPVTREVRERQGLDGDGGVVLEKTVPGTSAADGDFRAGDVILAIDGVRITGIPMFLRKVEEARAGDALALDVVRDGARIQKSVKLREKPREKGDGYDVLYGAVTSHGARLRTIVTRPKSGGRHPAVMLLQGYGCGSIDQPVGQPFLLTWLTHGLARHDYVTMRVDRPGCGDSEGGPCRDVDFETEIDGYREALRALKRLDFVDAGKVFLFGHSLGGSMGPIIAVDEPVRGIAVYGSGSETWFEGILGQRRRIASLDGTRPANVDRRMLGEARFWYALLVERKTPGEILEHFPELKKFGTTIGNTFEPMVTDDKYVGGRHYRFHHQAADKNLADVWTRIAATRLSSSPGAPVGDSHPRVLVLWGKSDWHVSREANAWIAEIINRETPGNASFVVLDAMDHFFYRAATPEEGFHHFIPARGAPAREFNPVILETLRRWLDETAKREKKPPEDLPVSRDNRCFSGMDTYIRAAIEKWEVPGLAIAIVKDDEVVLARGFGVCELGKDRKVTTDTAFPLASCWKSFQAAAVGLLVAEGKLRWDDPVARHLPDIELSDPYLTEHVTLRDLLCHRTGLRRCDLVGDRFEPEEILRRVKYIPLAADFRTKLTYSNAMYTVLDEVVTRVSGQPSERFIAERILRPLDMTSTTPATDMPPDRLASRHWRSDAGIVARPRSGEIYSTVGDMARWLRLQLAEGTFGDRRLLEPEIVREMHALQLSVPIASRPMGNIYAARFYGSGLGWFVQEYRGRKVVLHGGSWGAMVAMIPEEKLGVVVLSNLGLESLPGLLMYDVFDAYLVGLEAAWSRDKWEATWLRNEPPGHAYRPRDEARARLERRRTPGTKPSRPLKEYAGTFNSKLYGRLGVRHEGGRLSVTFGEFTTELSHWQDDEFYARSPTRLTFDWLLTCGVSGDGAVTNVTVKHVGWDRDEPDHLFVRGN